MRTKADLWLQGLGVDFEPFSEPLVDDAEEPAVSSVANTSGEQTFGDLNPVNDFGDGDIEPEEEEENVFNSAFDMDAVIDIEDNGWSYTWQWTYGGDKHLDGIATELLLEDRQGRIIDGAIEAPHPVEPGQTVIGGGRGNRSLPAGSIVWKLAIPYKTGFVGIAAGTRRVSVDPPFDRSSPNVPGDDVPLDDSQNIPGLGIPAGDSPSAPGPEGGGRASGGVKGPRSGAPMSGATEPTLRLGDQSADGWVEYLQELLASWGLPVNLTGKFDNSTQQSVIRFQQSKGLLVDGIVGNQTWAALRVENPRPIGTDGLAPHTFEQHGSQARWFTEPFMQAQYDALHDSLLLPAVNTGDVEFVEGSFPATATLTNDATGVSTDFTLQSFTGGKPAEPGGLISYALVGLSRLGPGLYTLVATLPRDLGGDVGTRKVEIEVVAGSGGE